MTGILKFRAINGWFKQAENVDAKELAFFVMTTMKGKIKYAKICNL